MARTVNISRKIFSKLSKFHILTLLLLLIVLGIAGNYSTVFQAKNTSSSVATAPKPVPHTTYTSKNLGISFTYVPVLDNGAGQYFYTKEIGDKVYIYWQPGVSQPFSGSDDEFLQTIAPHAKYVEVLSKDPQVSLVDAIKQELLDGYSSTDCVVSDTSGNKYPKQNKLIQTAGVYATIPHGAKISNMQLRSLVAKCPSFADGPTGTSYFMMDPKHPDKMLLIHLGQDNLPSGINGYTWDATITIQ